MHEINIHKHTYHTYTHMHKTLPKPVLISDDSQAVKSGRYNKGKSLNGVRHILSAARDLHFSTHRIL